MLGPVINTVQKDQFDKSYLSKESNGTGKKSLFPLFLFSLVRLGDDVVQPLEFVASEDVVKSFAYEAHRQHLTNAHSRLKAADTLSTFRRPDLNFYFSFY